MSHRHDWERIRAELKVCPHSRWHHGLQISLFQVSKAVAVGLVYCSQDLNHALFVLETQRETFDWEVVMVVGGFSLSKFTQSSPWNFSLKPWQCSIYSPMLFCFQIYQYKIYKYYRLIPGKCKATHARTTGTRGNKWFPNINKTQLSTKVMLSHWWKENGRSQTCWIHTQS